MHIRPVATGPPGCVASLSLNTPTLKKAGFHRPCRAGKHHSPRPRSPAGRMRTGVCLGDLGQLADEVGRVKQHPFQRGLVRTEGTA